MATYNYNTWETISLPIVTGDTYFRIFRGYTSNPGTATNSLYDGLIPSGLRLKNLNEVISPYVKTEDIVFPDRDPIGYASQDDEQYMNFTIYYSETPPGVTWNTSSYDIVYLKYNWAYTTTMPFLRSYRPINILDRRQYLLISIKDVSALGDNSVFVDLNNNIQDRWTLADGSIWHYALNLRELNYTVTRSSNSENPEEPGSTVIPLLYNNFWKLNLYDADRTFNYLYYITDTCYDYALYWLNDIGGWDYMLFAGKELKKDDIKRLQYKKEYNSQALSWGKVNYLTQITENWELNTSFVNNETSEKLQPLFHSNKIILNDLNARKLITVNITNKSVEHKNYTNQGRKAYSYTIQLESAQDKFAI